MNTMTIEPRTVRPMYHANPVLRRLSRVADRVDTDAATYSGIASKTAFLLLMTLAGIVMQLFVKGFFSSAPVWQSFTIYDQFAITLTQGEAAIIGAVLTVGFGAELLGIFFRRTIPVTGSLYAASQGYLISFLVFDVLSGYEYLGLEALLITVAVVAVMSRLYTSGRIRSGKKYHLILLSFFLGSVAVSVFSVLGFLFPLTRPVVEAMAQNYAVVIVLDVIGILIAALFLISDFSLVQDCVEQGYPKDYEWSAAFGLVFTVLWIYLKVLDLLMRAASKNR